MRNNVNEIDSNQSQRKFKCRKCTSIIQVRSSDSWGDALTCSCGAIYELLTLYPVRLELIGYKKEGYYRGKEVE